jgi:hypothetical protein
MTKDTAKRAYISVAVVPNTEESTIKAYLQSMGQEKPLIINALKGFYMPAGLLLDSSVSDSSVTKAVLDSVWLLMNQIREIRRSVDGSRASLEVIDGFVGSMIPGLCKDFGVTMPDNSDNNGSSKEVTKTISQSNYGNSIELNFET